MTQSDYYILKPPPGPPDWTGQELAAQASDMHRHVPAGQATARLNLDRTQAVVERDPGNPPPRGRSVAGPMTASECRAWIAAREADWQEAVV